MNELRNKLATQGLSRPTHDRVWAESWPGSGGASGSTPWPARILLSVLLSVLLLILPGSQLLLCRCSGCPCRRRTASPTGPSAP